MFCSPREAKKTCELMDYWPSFSVSNLDIGLKENLSWYTVLSLMSKILGWNLSLVIAFSIDKSEIYYIELSLIFKDETASLKKLFNASATSLSNCKNLLPSTGFILLGDFLY